MDDEYEACEVIEESLQEWGWQVNREAWSDSRTGRADFIISHPHAGTFGIEVKDLTSGYGRLVGEAIRQIAFEYRGLSFDGEPVTRWAFLPVMDHGDDRYQHKRRALLNMMKELGIGLIHVGRRGPYMKWGPSDYSNRKFSLEHPRAIKEKTLSEIDEYIEEKAGRTFTLHE